MKSFSILHLSDLHINDNEDPSCFRLRKSLLEDIKKMTGLHSLSIDAIAMTGDTFDKGGNSNSFRIAEEFYKELLLN